MVTSASIPQESANTIEDSEHLKILQFKGGTADTIPDGNGTVRSADNLVFLDSYREQRLTGNPEETETDMVTFGSSKTGDSPPMFQDTGLRTQERKQASSPEFIRITRAIFVKPILQALDAVQPFAQTPDAALYVHQILHQIRDFEAISPEDPLLEVLSGLYMALAYDNLWADYQAGQFTAIRKILQKFAGRPVLKPMDIEKAIMTMEEVGFNTTPIPIFIEESDE